MRMTVDVSKTLAKGGWRKLLRCWGDLMDEYTKLGRREKDDDVPYWYGERALTGLLGAAAWKCGGWSLEEFTGLRRMGKRRRAGRGDLWLGTGRGDFVIEAKIVWPGDPKRTRGAVRRALDQVGRQLRNLSPDFGRNVGKLMGICYVIPDVSERRCTDGQDPMKELLRHVGSTFRKGQYVLACYKPAIPKLYNHRCYPGAILIGRVVG